MKKKIVISLCICIGCVCFIIGILLTLIVFVKPIANIEIQKTIIEKESSNRDFIVQVFIAFGTCLAFFITLLVLLKDHFNKPKFTVSLKKEYPWYSYTEDDKKEIRHIYQLKVINKKQTTAKDVSVQLIKVIDLKDKNPVTRIFPLLFNLPNKNPEKTFNIPCGLESFVDFISVTLKKVTIDFDKQEYEYKAQLHFLFDKTSNETIPKFNYLDNGNYRVFFVIAGENFKPQKFYIDILLSFNKQIKLIFSPALNWFPELKEKAKLLNNSPNVDFNLLNFSNDISFSDISYYKE